MKFTSMGLIAVFMQHGTWETYMQNYHVSHLIRSDQLIELFL